MNKKIYVASSWRNEYQPIVVEQLKSNGYEVYDFRHPNESDSGFHWSEIDPNWKHWSVEEFKKGLGHPIAIDGFTTDVAALVVADLVVLVLPCGNSAHLEAGFAIGCEKPVIAFIPELKEPELMYSMFYEITTTVDSLLRVIKDLCNE